MYLFFGHKKLTKKAREYRHEIEHLTIDMLSINRKVNKNLAICDKTVKILGSKKQIFRVDLISERVSFYDLLYHLENFIFRLHAYRDKLCMLLNYMLKLGHSEAETGLYNLLIANDTIKKYHFDTELKKFGGEPIKELLSVRKAMSHRVYYEPKTYNPLFMPDESPKEIGYFKAANKWRNRMTVDVRRIDNSMEKIFEINKKVTEKLIVFLNKRSF